MSILKDISEARIEFRNIHGIFPKRLIACPCALDKIKSALYENSAISLKELLLTTYDGMIIELREHGEGWSLSGLWVPFFMKPWPYLTFHSTIDWGVRRRSMNRQAEADIRRKTKILEHAKQSGNVSHTYSKYGISRDSFYGWKKQWETGGREVLTNSKPCPQNPNIHVPKHWRKTSLRATGIRIGWVKNQLVSRAMLQHESLPKRSLWCVEAWALDNSSISQPFLPVLTIKQGQREIQVQPFPQWTERF